MLMPVNYHVHLKNQIPMKPTKENNHQDLIDQEFHEELGDGCKNFARFLLTFIVITILGFGILIVLIILS